MPWISVRLTLRELRLLEAAEAVVSSWEVYRDDLFDTTMPCATRTAWSARLNGWTMRSIHTTYPGDGGE
jgi:hypothetical protein